MDSGGLKTQENTNIHTSIRVENNKSGLRGISKRKAIEKFHSLFFFYCNTFITIFVRKMKKKEIKYSAIILYKDNALFNFFSRNV